MLKSLFFIFTFCISGFLSAQSIKKSDLFRMDYNDGSFIAAIIEKKPAQEFGNIKSFLKSDTVMERKVDNAYWDYAEIVDIPIMDFDQFLTLDPSQDTVVTVLYDSLGSPSNTMKTFYSYWEGKWRFIYDLEIKDLNIYDSFNCYKSGRYYFAEIDDVSVQHCEIVIDGEHFDGDHINSALIAQKKYLKKVKSLKFRFIAYDMNGNEVYNEEHTIKILKKGEFMML